MEINIKTENDIVYEHEEKKVVQEIGKNDCKLNNNILELIKIIGKMAQKVYTHLGSGFSEAIYHKAMEVEFRQRGLV